jgi:hypothetical protein
MSNQTILLNEMIVQAEGNLVSNMDDEKVMMSIQSGKYYNLGQVGGRIWDLIELPTSVEQLIEKLTVEFEIEQEECEKQVITFLQHLRNEQLIKMGDEVQN